MRRKSGDSRGTVRIHKIEGVSYKKTTGVFSPCVETKILIKNIRVKPHEKFLDMGGGSGVVGIYAAKHGAYSVTVDIAPQAVRAARANARLNVTELEAIQSDLFDRLEQRRFDVVAFNAPYTRLTKGGREDRRTQDRNKVSRQATVTRFLTELPRHLEDRGRAYLVLSSKSPIRRFLEAARRAKLTWNVTKEFGRRNEKVYLVELGAASF